MNRTTRRTNFLVPAALLLIQPACSTRSEPALPPVAPEAASFDPAALDRLSDALQQFVDDGKLSGIYAVIARNGDIAYEHTFGRRDIAARDPLRRDDIFRIYSMTKPVVAVGILRLVDQGRLSLDDPVSRYIPSFADIDVFNAGTADQPLTRQLPEQRRCRLILAMDGERNDELDADPTDEVRGSLPRLLAGVIVLVILLTGAWLARPRSSASQPSTATSTRPPFSPSSTSARTSRVATSPTV